ncbi:MAG TPA: hypothetical protein VE914_02700, partial [Candidatus Angelobacter sp.]|nr:hypothetical protein [Candidatus Angelobacter sp.]
RLPPAERPLTLRDIHAFLAFTQDRGETLGKLVLASVGAVACFALAAVGLHLATMTTAGRYGWPGIAVGAYFGAALAYKAWQAYCVRRLQGRFKPPVLG